jgi:hypothetical protein
VRISYELTVDDIVAANLLHFDHAPATAWMRTFVRWVGPGGALLVGLSSALGYWNNNQGDPPLWQMLLVIAVLSVASFFFLPWWARRLLARTSRKKSKNETLEGFVTGTRTMELSGTRLAVRTRLGESSFDLSVIKDIVAFEDYALIYLTSTQMHVIPMKNILPEEEYHSFVARLREAWEAGDMAKSIQEASRKRADDRITR